MIDVKGCVCAACSARLSYKIIDSLAAVQSKEDETHLVKGPFIEIVPCRCQVPPPQPVRDGYPRAIRDSGSYHLDVPER